MEPEEGEHPLEEVEEAPAERRYPSTIGGALYLAMLAVILGGILVVVLGSWRVGIRIFAGALVAGAGLRIVLKEQDAGMLAVRSKPVDVGLYLLVGGALATLASVIPDQPL
ncbi:DUF3017 domain-containing protein [Nocardioides daphniae]|uniref:DUF3017 domain-containing protein n=1 Tax=Nocardioides daphniae TaxID=402297 RepID=A0A4P7UET1_9ACTN|nr:DUF3017 domain-containing protein [Nocardioides daphniae]QCC77935.1 DUF3017 domain-containing protein [Nocardioides daphniae]